LKTPLDSSQLSSGVSLETSALERRLKQAETSALEICLKQATTSGLEFRLKQTDYNCFKRACFKSTFKREIT